MVVVIAECLPFALVHHKYFKTWQVIWVKSDKTLYDDHPKEFKDKETNILLVNRSSEQFRFKTIDGVIKTNYSFYFSTQLNT